MYTYLKIRMAMYSTLERRYDDKVLYATRKIMKTIAIRLTERAIEILDLHTSPTDGLSVPMSRSKVILRLLKRETQEILTETQFREKFDLDSSEYGQVKGTAKRYEGFYIQGRVWELKDGRWVTS